MFTRKNRICFLRISLIKSYKTIETAKKGINIINTSRGALIDSAELVDALKNGKVGGAALDVYEEESDLFFEDFSNKIIQDDVLARLVSLPNVMLTAHQAFFTEEALKSIAETTLNNLKEYFESGKMHNEICYKCEKLTVCEQDHEKPCF